MDYESSKSFGSCLPCLVMVGWVASLMCTVDSLQVVAHGIDYLPGHGGMGSPFFVC